MISLSRLAVENILTVSDETLVDAVPTRHCYRRSRCELYRPVERKSERYLDVISSLIESGEEMWIGQRLYGGVSALTLYLLEVFVREDRGVWLDVVSGYLPALEFFSGLEVASLDGPVGLFDELVVPLTQRVAVPRHLGIEFG